MKPVAVSEPPRALITGACGFTGHYLAREFEAAGYKVFGLVHHQVSPVSENYFPADLGDRNTVEKVVSQVNPDVVVHLAAVSFAAHDDAEEIYRTNVVGTRNLLAALARCATAPRAVLLASSGNLYGNAATEVIDESTEPQPANDYAVSKLAMEYMARLWLDRLPIIIARPFNYTGVGQDAKFLVPKIVAAFRSGQKVLELGNLDVYRDFSDVRDVSHTYRLLVERAPAGELFNVASGQAYSIGDILTMMREISGRDMEIVVNPAFVRANEVKRLLGSTAKLHHFLGSVRRTPLGETLRWMYQEGGT